MAKDFRIMGSVTMKRRVLLLLTLVLAVLTVVITMFYIMRPNVYQRHFSHSNQAVPNPLMGYAPPAATQDSLTQDVNLLYVDVTWRDLEPQKGKYNWESLEKKFRFEKWRREGKHLVLRFVLDYPQGEVHKDIPDWLYREMEDPGDWYDTSYGKGFSPNYSNPKLISYYGKIVSAMGRRWGKDGFISFIELGGLGHWGEWQVKQDSNIRSLPKATIQAKYVKPWLSAFSKADLLMRRPFKIAQSYQLGLYNDMSGNVESTETWLDWIELGGSYDQTGEKKALVPMPNAWKKSPIGGELASDPSLKVLLGRQLNKTLNLLEESHTSFLGPKIAEDIGDDRRGYQKVLKKLGYRLWIASASLKLEGNTTTLSLSWRNSGIAPFYRNWRAYVYVQNWSGQTIERIAIPLNLTKLLPNTKEETTVKLKTPNVIKASKNQYRISVGIVDPMTGKDAVHFAVAGQEDQKRLLLFE